MSNIETLEAIHGYIRATRYATLIYVREDLNPIAREIGSYIFDGGNLYFSTGRESAKVREITVHPGISIYFKQDGQSLEAWKSVLLIGIASELQSGNDEYTRVVSLISEKSPRFRQRAESGELSSAVIYRVTPGEFHYLDYSRNNVPEKISVD
ncbi:MAG: pyridoxamine 5'-phosphate oxidase family protein [Chlorobiaceae bacterium]|nr:pyridoxamine 5'-phosphate oxidase family protein [Chlorobiaceae bacterium]